MSYDNRLDGRKFDELRPIEAKAGVVKRANGSAMFKIGNTWAIAAVYGPRELHPKFLQNPKEGILRVYYNMMPFAGMGDRVRPGPSRRSKEISMVTEKALIPVVDLTEFPNSVVDIFLEFPQTDAGSRCAGICAASIALADAGIPMRDLVTALAVGKVDDRLVVDLNYDEEAFEAEVADIPMAVIPSTQKITLLQMDGIIEKERLSEVLRMGLQASEQIYQLQKKALKSQYVGWRE
jgi:exosome complex component RRP41